jgi:SOS-response transcriptional repressor LexA
MSDDRPEPAKRLETARIHRGFATAKDASRYFGWVYETYIQHEQGIRGIGRQSKKYADAFRVSEGWLLTGEGEGPGHTPLQRIPILTWVSAGTMARDDGQQDIIGETDAADLDPKGRWIALRVEGDSMDRISPPGSLIFVNMKDRRLVPNACYIITNGDGEATYKRFRANPPRFEPVSTNPAHEPIFPDGEPAVLGRVRRSVLEM